MTVSAFSSLSLSPPLVLFSIGAHAPSIDAWRRAKRYIVNILSEDQESLSARFGKPSGDKWNEVEFQSAASGVVFPGTLAALECESDRQFKGGDHIIFVGRVMAAFAQDQNSAGPLVHFGGRYHRVAPHRGRAAARAACT
jgi:flavin reductase (DIM6/NTAB) family NADH-FMN oxidoreductase RutF